VRVVTIQMGENMKYSIFFLKEGNIKWTIESYVLTGQLPNIVSEWLEKEIHPPYGYS
jgi:hypothetical protein